DSGARRLPLRVLTGVLSLLQPIARLVGRVRHGLTPWRHHGRLRYAWPVPRRWALWSEQWRPHADWIGLLRNRLRSQGIPATYGGAYAHWDLEIRHGATAGVRVQVA